MATLSVAYLKEKWQHAGFQKYFQNTGWIFSMKVLSMIVSFIATLFIARNLGPTNFGQLSYAISFVGIFSFIASLGIDNILYRELIKYPDRRKEFLGSAFMIKITGGVIGIILISIFALLWATDDVSKILIIIISGTFIFNPFQIIGYEFQAQVKSKYPSIIAFVATLILNILKVIIILEGKGVIYLALILLLEPIIYALFYWIIYEKQIGSKISQWRFDKDIAIALLKDSWPLIFSGAFALVYSEIDQILIKNMIDAHAVGIYDSAVRVAEVWYFVPNIIMMSLFPAIINAKIVSAELYLKRLKKLSLLLTGLAVSIAIITTLFAPAMIYILYGVAFMSGTIILQIYVWSLIGSFLGSLVANYLVAENYRHISFFVNLIPMIVNVILDIYLIPKYGIIGPAWATLMAYSLSPMILLLFARTRKTILEIIKI
jgi:O-antigen/teichoic acid export membrane protein